MRSFILAASLAAAALPAQNVVVADINGGPFFEQPGVSQLYPAMGGVINSYIPAPPLPGIPVGIPSGGITIDSTSGNTWYTDGFTVAVVPHNLYPPAVPPPGPYPTLFPGGAVTGMALDPIGGILWMTDGVVIAGFPPGFPAPPIVPPFVPGIPIGPLTGLDWDPITGSLWACDIGGVSINFLPGGAPLAGPFPPPGASTIYTGICIDKTGLALLGFRAVHLAGAGLIEEVFSGAVIPTPIPQSLGISYHAAPSYSPISGPCACGSMNIGHNLLGPMVTGNPAFGVDMTGLTPGQPVFFFLDGAINPVRPWPLMNTLGCPLGLILGSPTIGARLAIVNAAGVASSPFNLSLVPPGSFIYMQPGMLCNADPQGFVLGPLYQFMVSAP